MAAAHRLLSRRLRLSPLPAAHPRVPRHESCLPWPLCSSGQHVRTSQPAAAHRLRITVDSPRRLNDLYLAITRATQCLGVVLDLPKVLSRLQPLDGADPARVRCCLSPAARPTPA